MVDIKREDSRMTKRMLGKSAAKAALASLLAVSALAGCASKDKEPAATGNDSQSGKTVSVKVFKSHMGVGSIPDANNAHVKYVAEKTGVQYQLLTTPPGSEPTEYLNLMIASSELPDILRPIGGIEQTLIKQGGALALDDLLPKYAPNVWKNVPQEAWDIVRSASPDGHIYYVPKVFLVPERAPLIRKDWLDNVGMQMPKTVAEYKEVLKAFRDKDPNKNGAKDELPTSGREYGKWMDHLFGMYGVAMWEGSPEWDEYNGQIQYAGVTANMKAAIGFIRELYAEKLLDNETFLNKGDVWQAKINNNLVGSWYHLPASIRDRYTAMLKGDPKAYVVAMPMPKAEGFQGFVTQKSMGEPEWMIPASAKGKAEASLKLLDFFYDSNNAEFTRFGIEGLQHQVVDGKKVLLPAEDSRPLGLGMRNLTTKEDMDLRIKETIPENMQKMVSDMFVVSTADARRIAGDGLPNTVYEGFPDIQSHKLFQEYLTKIVIGEWPIEKFDEFVDRWKKAGGETVTKRVQEWYAKVKK
jgi:putative aldouronate transport system substrate-binding protein